MGSNLSHCCNGLKIYAETNVLILSSKNEEAEETLS